MLGLREVATRGANLAGRQGFEPRYRGPESGECVSLRSAPEKARGRRAASSLQDREHKMILLLEYLSRCGSKPAALARAANSGMS